MARGKSSLPVARLTGIAPEISALVHELQKERGRSAGFIGSGGDAALGDKLDAQRRETDGKAQAADAALADFDASAYSPALASEIAALRRHIAELARVRGEISAILSCRS